LLVACQSVAQLLLNTIDFPRKFLVFPSLKKSCHAVERGNQGMQSIPLHHNTWKISLWQLNDGKVLWCGQQEDFITHFQYLNYCGKNVTKGSFVLTGPSRKSRFLSVP